MLNESQKAVFQMVADNKAMFECLKEYFQLRFSEKINSEGLTNEQLGAIARAQYEGLQKINQVFVEIESCKSVHNSIDTNNPAR